MNVTETFGGVKVFGKVTMNNRNATEISICVAFVLAEISKVHIIESSGPTESFKQCLLMRATYYGSNWNHEPNQLNSLQTEIIGNARFISETVH